MADPVENRAVSVPSGTQFPEKPRPRLSAEKDASRRWGGGGGLRFFFPTETFVAIPEAFALTVAGSGSDFIWSRGSSLCHVPTPEKLCRCTLRYQIHTKIYMNILFKSCIPPKN